ncbi:hypothetical protein ElyMa_006037500 [Elysia marginata]|uniref:Ion transport domain-containing protein n=1 Tax=Elysia marginata TaxID=1093978 RepID=A0AAV4GL72_9GAST|nr:hypothetical protein ElyMa_006037500 [Elysia marginata]
MDHQNCMMNTYISATNPSPLKQLGSKLRNATSWGASRNKNTNRNPCTYYQPYSPGQDTSTCSKPLINVRCDRGGWLEDLRRLGIINFVGDILTLLTFIAIMFAIAEYFLCPTLNAKGSNSKPYFFCSSCEDVVSNIFGS